MTDLTTRRDHPSAILDKGGRTAAAARLRVHEQEFGVTFAALDNDALTAVREAYEAKRANPSDNLGGDLADAIRDLLGLDD